MALAVPAECLSPGDVVDQFSIVEKIGEGGMGVVYSGWQPKLGRHVALKFLHPADANRPDARERFIREARALARVSHPNIVQVYDVVETERPYIVMELLLGETLRETIAEGPVKPALVIRYGQQLNSALGALSAAGLVHRDLKPENVMLVTDSDGNEVVKVFDFGVVAYTGKRREKELGAARLTKSSATPGTVGYHAPETCADASNADPRSDLYQLGLLLYELLTTKKVFAAGELKTALFDANALGVVDTTPLKEFDRDLFNLVTGLLEKEPNKRPMHAEVKATLDRLAPAPTKLPWRRLSVGAALFAALAIAAAGGGRRYAQRARMATLKFELRQSLPETKELAGGWFWMGRSPEELEREVARVSPYRSENFIKALREKMKRQTRHQAFLPPFRLDETEVTWLALARWINTLPKKDWVMESGGTYRYRHNENMVKIFDNDDAQRHVCGLELVGDLVQPVAGCSLKPVVGITEAGAEEFCRSVGRHLMTSEEYEYAARGMTNRMYPWGDAPPTCEGAAYDQFPMYPPDPNIQWTPACPQILPTTHNVKDARDDVTPEGVRGLFGNVSEITSTLLVPGNPAQGYVVRGTNLASTEEWGPTSFQSRILPDEARHFTGFRCGSTIGTPPATEAKP